MAPRLRRRLAPRRSRRRLARARVCRAARGRRAHGVHRGRRPPRGVRNAAERWLHERARGVRSEPLLEAVLRGRHHVHGHRWGRSVLRSTRPDEGREMKKLASAFAAGLVLAIGLGISGMTNPEKIIGFLDVAGRWDPSLAFVMAG